MIYAATKLVEAAFTTTLVNAQITALNTAFGAGAASLAAVQNGWLHAPKDGSSFPCLTYWVGDADLRSEMKRMGKRDTLIGVRLLVLSREAALADSWEDLAIAAEALQTVLESLRGTQYGSTGRYVVDTLDPVLAFVGYNLDGEVIRHGAELRFSLAMRTEGV